jgi:hypothetical protein
MSTNNNINTKGSNIINTNGSNNINTNGSIIRNTKGSNIINTNGSNNRKPKISFSNKSNTRLFFPNEITNNDPMKTFNKTKKILVNKNIPEIGSHKDYLEKKKFADMLANILYNYGIDSEKFAKGDKLEKTYEHLKNFIGDESVVDEIINKINSKLASASLDSRIKYNYENNRFNNKSRKNKQTLNSNKASDIAKIDEIISENEEIGNIYTTMITQPISEEDIAEQYRKFSDILGREHRITYNMLTNWLTHNVQKDLSKKIESGRKSKKLISKKNRYIKIDYYFLTLILLLFNI